MAIDVHGRPIDTDRYDRFEIRDPLPDVELMPIIDVDTHMSEPADIWTSRVSTKKWGDLVPHVQWVKEKTVDTAVWGNESGMAWLMGDTIISMAPSASTGRDDLNIVPPTKPQTYEEAHPASYLLKDRIELMNSEGVYCQALYPNVAGFGAQKFQGVADLELRLELVRAYNDWLYEWSFPAKERFILNAAMPFWDVDATVKEIYRVKDLGFRGILWASRPNVHGLPWIMDEHWNPVWEAATETGIPINFHIGAGSSEDSYKPWPGADKSTMLVTSSTMAILSNSQAITELTMAGMLQKWPGVKWVSVESGIGWIPYLMEALDHEFNCTQLWKKRPEFERLPSEYIREHVWSTFWFEETGPERLLDVVGEDRVMFETDFPHPTKLYPAMGVKAHISNSLSDHTPEVRKKLLYQNAADLYGVELPVDQSWRTQTV